MSTFEDGLLIAMLVFLILISWQLSLLHADNVIDRFDRRKARLESVPLEVVQRLFAVTLGPAPAYEPLHRDPESEEDNNRPEGH